MGKLDIVLISFNIGAQTPISVPQYSMKPQAPRGIEETVLGLFKAGVIYPTQSDWNTPILPALKTDGVTPLAVPNPATALS